MNAMSKTVITVRIDSNKRDMVKGKCDKARISMNQLFERLCDLIINDSINVTEKGISLGGTEEKETSDNEDTHSLLMQIAVINKRLNKLENIVGNECRINAVNECSVSEQNMNADSADSAVIMNEEPIKKETTKESTLSECLNLPLNEELGDKVPTAENKAINVEIVENEDKLTKERVIELLKKHKIPTIKENEETLVLNNNELLYPFFSELLGKTVNSNSLNKVANKKDKHYVATAVVWEFFTVDKVKGKWIWTRVK